MKSLNRDGKKKRENRNLIRRGRIYYFKKMERGGVKFISLGTDDLELAKAKRNEKEQEVIAGELSKIRGVRTESAATFQKIFDAYESIGGITDKALRGNKSSMQTMLRTVLGKEEINAEKITIDVLSKKFVRDYQDTVRKAYELEAGTNEKARRMARDRADRTSMSTFNQAKSIFTESRDLIDRYTEKGLHVPECVKEFGKTKAVGEWTSKVYFPPNDKVLTETFTKIEELRESEPDVYRLFWVSLGTGCRKNESADMTLEDLMELEGALWVGAGLGKDGRQIQIPVINWAVHPASQTIPVDVIRSMVAKRKAELEKIAVLPMEAEVKDAVERVPTTLFGGSHNYRHDALPKRLNEWLTSIGWKDEKKMHGLRAFIGCRIFEDNPRRAQRYMRHKSIQTTEEFYGHFLDLKQVVKIAPVQTPGQVAA